MEGKVSNSHFLPRKAPEAISLSLQAFGFVGVDSDVSNSHPEMPLLVSRRLVEKMYKYLDQLELYRRCF